MSEFVGRWVAWLVLAAVLISALNAAVRKAFNTSSNAYLEIQWYLFAAVFLLAAGYTLLRQEHVQDRRRRRRASRKRTQIWIDIFGLAFFLLPLVVHGHPPVDAARRSARTQIGEMSSNAGGLIRWPVYAMLPLGFAAAAACRRCPS